MKHSTQSVFPLRRCIVPISGAKKGGGVVVVIVWKFDLELHVQSVHITEFESRSWLGVRDTTLCDKVCQ